MDIRTSVPALLAHGRPAAVHGPSILAALLTFTARIVPVAIYSVDAMTSGAISHHPDEVVKIVPTNAHTDAATAIQMKVPAFCVGASLQHGIPTVIYRSPGQAVSYGHLLQSQASTASRITTPQRCIVQDLFCPAIARAQRTRTLAIVISHSFKDDPSTESLAEDIDVLRHGRSPVTFSCLETPVAAGVSSFYAIAG
jgi:hypothetical protein